MNCFLARTEYAHRDLDVQLDWLKEALLGLEPEDPEVQVAAHSVLSEVGARCEELHRELTSLGEKTTARKLRVVSRLLHVPTS